MDDAPLPIIDTPKEKFIESFEIKQEEKNYKLNIDNQSRNNIKNNR